MKTTRKQYTKEFKLDAVRLVTEQGCQRFEAANRFLKENHVFSADKQAELADLQQASRLTPHYVSNCNLQVVNQLGVFPDIDKALAALQKAQTLDSSDSTTQMLIRTLGQLVKGLTTIRIDNFPGSMPSRSNWSRTRPQTAEAIKLLGTNKN